MFSQLPQQHIADRFKGWLMKTPTPMERSEAIDQVKHFEQSRWFPDLFQQAVDAVAPGEFQIDGRAINYKGTDNQARRAALDVLMQYDTLVNGRERSKVIADTMGTKEAVQYVSAEIAKRGKHLAPRGVQRYVDMQDNPLKARIVGKTRIFAKADLDAFIEYYVNTEIKTGPKVGSHHKEKA